MIFNNLLFSKPKDRVKWKTPSRVGPEKAFLFENRSGLKILEIGCTNAVNKRYFISRGHHYTGLDISSQDADVIADMHDLPFPDHSFDAILVNSTLQYSIFIPRCLKEMHRTISPQGFLTGSVPFLEPSIWGSYHHFTATGFRFMLLQNGFLPVNIWVSWNVFDAITEAISKDKRIPKKAELLQLLRKSMNTDAYRYLSGMSDYAGSFNFYAKRKEL